MYRKILENELIVASMDTQFLWALINVLGGDKI